MRPVETGERAKLREFLKAYLEASPVGMDMLLPGPVGEENRLRILPRGRVLGIADTVFEALHQSRRGACHRKPPRPHRRGRLGFPRQASAASLQPQIE